MHFDDGIYPKFVEARTACLVDSLGDKFFSGKRVLEVGCGYGYAGELFEKMGAKVASLDAREEHVNIVRERYPKRETFVIDLNSGYIPGEFDIIVAFGLLYHLELPHHFMAEALGSCETICICSVVCDTEDNILKEIKGETTFDQGMTDVSYMPSARWIKEAIESHGFSCKDVSSARANVAGNKFDWRPYNDGKFLRDGCYLRKMFVGEKK